MSPPAEPADTRETPRGHSTWRSGLILLLLSTLFCLAAAETGTRFILRHQFGISFMDPGRILYAFYPGLEAVERDRPSHADAFYDILLLGGSVLDKRWGSVEKALLEELAYRGHRKVRLYNMAMEGHTSRDSLLKYQAMTTARFDLVIFYHGINETRANNVPPELFQEDYGHYSWYELVNSMAPLHARAHLALPLALRYLGLKLKQTVWSGRYVPSAVPRGEWLAHGANMASVGALEANLESLLTHAAERGDPLLLMTFATWVPDSYSRSLFKAHQLDYGLHLFPLELWGTAEHVQAGIHAHNQVVERMAGGRPGVSLVDQARLMASSPRSFNDICHLTVAGSQQFVSNMMPAVLAGHQTSCTGCP